MFPMDSLAKCPDALPDDLTALVAQFGRLWAVSPHRPRISAAVQKHWKQLLDDWVNNQELPLFVRKSSSIRGSATIHETGREIVHCDNSPAHWAYIMASSGECPTLIDIQSRIRSDTIPVVMIQKTVEKPLAKYHCSLPRAFNVNKYGWKLAHIHPVGMKTRALITHLPIDKIASRFKSLMSPSNMFVVPLAWSGIAEAQSVINAVAEVDLASFSENE